MSNNSNYILSLALLELTKSPTKKYSASSDCYEHRRNNAHCVITLHHTPRDPGMFITLLIYAGHFLEWSSGW